MTDHADRQAEEVTASVNMELASRIPKTQEEICELAACPVPFTPSPLCGGGEFVSGNRDNPSKDGGSRSLNHHLRPVPHAIEWQQWHIGLSPML
jgi:hypothetical protein